jgi:hypothetical protein
VLTRPSFSGVQLATGTAVEQPQMFGPPQKQKVDPEPAAAIAALCAILGLGLRFVGPRSALGPAVSGALGAVSLLFMKSRLDDQIFKQGHGMLQLNYESGFSLALVLLIAGTAWNAYLFAQRKGVPTGLPSTLHPYEGTDPDAAEMQRPVGHPPPSSLSVGGGAPRQSPAGPPDNGYAATATARFCPNCGAERMGQSKFCLNCGKPVVLDTPAAQG